MNGVRSWLLSLVMFIGILTAGGVAHAYDISGTVTNNSSASGRVFVSIVNQSGGDTGLGVSVGNVAANGSANYAIRGVQSGSYIVNAFLDTQGSATLFANSPVGASIPFTVTTANSTGVNVAVSPPPAASLTSQLQQVGLAPYDKGAFVFWDTQSMQDQNGRLIPESFNIKYGPTAALGTVKNVPSSNDANVLFINGLTNGSKLNVKVVPVVKGLEDAAHASGVIGPVTIGNPVGLSTVTGQVLSAGITKSASTPLYLALEGSNGNFITAKVGSPADTQSYSISGVPAGTYKLHSIIDMNNNWSIDTGDAMSDGDSGNHQAPTVTADGINPVTAPVITFSPLTGAQAQVGTTHSRNTGGDWYNLNFNINKGARQPVNVAITSGANLPSAPVDLALSQWGGFSYWANLQMTRPAVGDSYAVHVDYSSGLPEDLSLPVTAVLDSFATPIYPVGNSAADSTTPLFSWRTPFPLPAGYYDYSLWVNNSTNFGNIWNPGNNGNNMTASQLSILFNSDNNAFPSQLTPGTDYSWTLTTNDAFGNQAQNQVNFTPQNSGPSVTGFIPAGGPAGTSVVITGSGFDSVTPANNSVFFGGIKATAVSVTSSTQITATVPPIAPVGPVTVTVNGTTASSPASFAATTSFSGATLDFNKNAVSGVSISIVGSNPVVSTSSDGSGNYTIALPSGVPVSLQFSKAGFRDVFSGIMSTTGPPTIGANYTLFTDADIAGVGLSPLAGKGLIFTRVTDWANFNTNRAGAVVTATSRLHPDVPYTVYYTNPAGGALVSGPGASTFTDGRFLVPNVDEGDYVTATATFAGWGFEPRTYITHANAVSENRIKGVTLPVVTPNPAGGTYGSPQNITLSGDKGGYSIFYTTNGSDPAQWGALLYTAPIPVSSTTTLKYYAKYLGISGNVGTADYVFLPLAITSANTATFTKDVPGTFTVTTAGAAAPQLNMTGFLPTGVTFTNNGDGTATISGTTANTGTYNITISAADNGNTVNQNFTLTVVQAPAITSSNSVNLTAGGPGFFTVFTSGYPAPSLNAAGSLPGGVTFTDNGNGTATISGTPAAGSGGSYPLTITANNGIGANAAQNFTLTINQTPAITSANAKTFAIGSPGTITVTTTGYPAPALIITAGALPTGVSFTDNGNGTAAISGTPAVGTVGTYPVIITASNGIGAFATQNFTLTVQAVAISSANAATFFVGSAGTFTVTTAGSPVPALSMTAGTLPTGVNFTDNGNGTATLGGTPAVGTAGTYPITVTAANINGTATQSFTLTVTAQITPTITWSNPNDIGSYTALSATQLNATASFSGISVPGTFFYNPPVGNTLGVGTQTLSVTFTPTDGVLYTTANKSVSVNVLDCNGDMNGTGGVGDISDALLALKTAVGLHTATAQEFARGKVSPFVSGHPTPTTNTITISDALIILKKAVHLLRG